MKFKAHPDFTTMVNLRPAIERYQELALKHGISDIFQDNGGKQLQIILLLGLVVVPGREGNDARTQDGQELELKTVNLDLQNQFTTHHHLNPTIIAKYRKVPWVFGFYRGITLKAVYLLEIGQIEPKFVAWEKQWHDRGGRDINNPKIASKFVLEHGELLWGEPPDLTRPKRAPVTRRPRKPRA